MVRFYYFFLKLTTLIELSTSCFFQRKHFIVKDYKHTYLIQRKEKKLEQTTHESYLNTRISSLNIQKYWSWSVKYILLVNP